MISLHDYYDSVEISSLSFLSHFFFTVEVITSLYFLSSLAILIF